MYIKGGVLTIPRSSLELLKPSPQRALQGLEIRFLVFN